jgi:5'-3' exonuclease
MRVHLVDGTYELFRAFYGAPPRRSPSGREVGATQQLLRSTLALVQGGATHIAAAFDTVIESFRNELFPGYKTGEGLESKLADQFPLAERATHALGIVTWGMIEFEADDALATAAARFAQDERVDQIVICSPDKDLAQCVRGERVVLRDRMRKKTLDEAGVVAKYGVPPASIADWLALVGDNADGYPGIARWGAKSAAQVVARYGSIDAIPDDERAWDIQVRGAAQLAANLREHRREAELYRTLARLREDAPLAESLDDIAWRGARKDELEPLVAELGMNEQFLAQVPAWRA